MKKRMVSIAALMALAMVMAGCSGGKETAETQQAEAGGETTTEAAGETSAEASGEEKTIAVVTYSLAEEFGVDVVKGATAKAEELGGINIVYPDAAGDMQKSIAIVEDLTTQGVDAICIAPVDADAIIPYIDKAREAGIVVVNWDIETQAEVDAKVLTDNFEGGAMGADYLVEKMGKEGTVLIVDDLESVTSTYERNKGFEDRLKEIAPDVKVIRQLSSGTRDTHRSTVENMLQAYPEITGIFCPDGDRTLGAYIACQANNRQDVLIAGYDATPEQLEIMLADGPECNMICATALHPDRLGALSVELADKILKGEEVEPVTYSEIDLMKATEAEKWVTEE